MDIIFIVMEEEKPKKKRKKKNVADQTPSDSPYSGGEKECNKKEKEKRYPVLFGRSDFFV